MNSISGDVALPPPSFAHKNFLKKIRIIIHNVSAH